MRVVLVPVGMRAPPASMHLLTAQPTFLTDAEEEEEEGMAGINAKILYKTYPRINPRDEVYEYIYYRV